MSNGALQHLDAARDARGLSWSAKLVLFVLVAFMGPRGIFPSQETIANAASISKRSVWTALTELQARGVVRASRGRRTQTSSYTIDLEALRALAVDSHRVRVAAGASRTTCESDSHDVRAMTRTTCEQKEQREKELIEGTKITALQLAIETPPEPAAPTPEAEVWSHFQTVRKRWRSRSRSTAIGDKDRREIKAQLKAGYTVDDLKLAVDGLFLSVFHRENDYLALTYALREKSIANFIDAAEREQRTKPPPSREVDRGPRFATEVAPRSLDEANASTGDAVDPSPPPTFDLGALAERLKAS